ncbi:hypothetical protein ACH4KU_08265 [Streptomyces althioticus]|uniref:hypothetical protein n=1 Tax=Streptomyces TaxID=1883 RepID=UPI0033CABD0C
MDSTETARRLLGHGAVSRPYAQLTGGHVANTPIYAELVAEWRAMGHTVPGHREGAWASFAVLTPADRGPVPAVPFCVPVLLPAAGERERVSGGRSGQAPCQEAAEAKPSDETSERTSGEVHEAMSEGRPSQSRGTTPSGGPPEDALPHSRRSREVMSLRERSRGMPDETPGAAAPRGAVPEQAPDPEITSSQDSAPR